MLNTFCCPIFRDAVTPQNIIQSCDYPFCFCYSIAYFLVTCPFSIQLFPDIFIPFIPDFCHYQTFYFRAGIFISMQECKELRFLNIYC
jgi:hypothetical protein